MRIATSVSTVNASECASTVSCQLLPERLRAYITMRPMTRISRTTSITTEPRTPAIPRAMVPPTMRTDARTGGAKTSRQKDSFSSFTTVTSTALSTGLPARMVANRFTIIRTWPTR